MEVIITNKDVGNLRKFMILHSKKAKRQKMMSFYAVPFEFIVVGLILDGLLKTVPILSLTSLVLAILWLIFFPKYYTKICNKELVKSDNLPESKIKMKFNVDENNITFSNDEKPKPSEIFNLNSLDKIAKTKENYFISFKEGHHIVLPLSDETTEKINEIKSRFSKGDIEEVTL